MIHKRFTLAALALAGGLFASLNASALNGMLNRVARQRGAVGHVEGTLPALGQGGACGRNNNCRCHGDSLILCA